MKKTGLLGLLLFGIGVQLVLAQEPHWWANARKTDAYDMYEKAYVAGAESEADARRAAVSAAKALLVEQIGIIPAMKEMGLDPSPEYAIVDFEIYDNFTSKDFWGKWEAWVLIKYPQSEKQKLVQRWEKSLESLQDLARLEKTIPVQFKSTLKTINGRTAFQAGETVQFVLEAERDCHVLLFVHQADGTSVLLYPNRFHKDGFLPKGRALEVPKSGDSNFQLLVGPPFGDDRIELIAATAKTALHWQYAQMLDKLNSGEDLVVLSRDVFAKALDKKQANAGDKNVLWSRSQLIMSTFQAQN